MPCRTVSASSSWQPRVFAECGVDAEDDRHRGLAGGGRHRHALSPLLDQGRAHTTGRQRLVRRPPRRDPGGVDDRHPAVSFRTFFEEMCVRAASAATLALCAPHPVHDDAAAGAGGTPRRDLCAGRPSRRLAGTLRRDIVAEDLPPLLAVIVEASHDEFYVHRRKCYMELILDGLSTPAPSGSCPQLARALAQLARSARSLSSIPSPSTPSSSASPTSARDPAAIAVVDRARRRCVVGDGSASNTKWPT